MNTKVYHKDSAYCEYTLFNADTGNLVTLYSDSFDIESYTKGNGANFSAELQEIELTAEQAAGYLIKPHYREHYDGKPHVLGLVGGCKLLHSNAGGWYLYF